MDTISALLLLIIVIFSVYNICVLAKYGIPNTLSLTYYWFKRTCSSKGLLFPILLCLICAITIPIWIYVDCQLQFDFSCVWMVYATWFALMIVCLTARYNKTKKRWKIHYSAAIASAIFTLSWIIIKANFIVYYTAIVLILALWAAYLTKTIRTHIIYWLELSAFYSIFITLFILNTFYIAK
ncbi:MAG: hypothetical protein MJZ64_02055 [Paludibacteraceae bacterium]|nr:hypothetical protein [Paludibacteraceae bacterium]